MTIKSRISKLEKQRVGTKDILIFRALCADTNRQLTEQSRRAIFTCGSVTEAYQRKAGEHLRKFEKRVLQEGGKLAVEHHPNSVFVDGGVKGHAN